MRAFREFHDPQLFNAAQACPQASGRKWIRSFLAAAVASTVLSGGLWAGGYLTVSNTGVPFGWDNTGPLPRDIDGGGLGIIADPVAFTEAATDGWAAEPTLTLAFTSTVGGLAADGDVDTVAEFAAISGPAPDGLSPIIFDVDGSLFAALGFPPGVIGFAAIDFVTVGPPFTIIESIQAYNGAFVDGVGANGELTPAEMGGAITHEQGHALNFDHTQVNGQFFIGDVDDPGFATYGAPPAGVGIVNIMFPFALGAGNSALTPNRDDLSTAEFLYGNGTGLTGVISGSIFRSDGSTLLQGANVIGRNPAAPFVDAVSSVSGYLYFPSGMGPGPTPPALEGAYDLRGLTPAATYTVEKVQVNPVFVGGSGVGPVDPPIPIAVEEFYNGASEAATEPPDAPLDSVLVAASASGIDIICSNLISLGDDDFIEVPLPFTFPFCGINASTVFINSNGSLTFGAGSTDFSESVADFIGGPPRIAALWDDLNPSSGGTISAESVGADFVVTFTDVPEFFSVGANSFSVTMRPDGTFEVVYGALTTTDALVGRWGFVDPGEIDLSAAAQPISATVNEAAYELFDAADLDLAGQTLEFASCPDLLFSVASPDVCYASTGRSDGGRLLTIDVATGAGTLVGTIGLGGVPGLAINSQGEMFATQRISGDLYRIDADTGAGLRIGSTGVTFLDAIAFDENDVLYGIGFDPPFFNLRTIDTATGASTVVGPTDDIFTGLAADPITGELYASVGGFLPVNPDSISLIDKITGAPSLVGSTGLGGAIPDIHFFGSQLFGAKGGGFVANSLITIDQATGAGTVVGPFGFTSVSGLASLVEFAADLEITMTTMPGSLVYTITVINNGPGNATGVVVTDPLPVQVVYVSDTCGGSNVPPWTWTIGDLANGAMVSCDLVVNFAPFPTGPFTNTATVTGDQFDPVLDPVTNSNTVSTDNFATPPAEIPTLGEFGLFLLLAGLGIGGALILGRSS